MGREAFLQVVSAAECSPSCTDLRLCRLWRDHDLQRGQLQCLLPGGGKVRLYGRHAAHTRHSASAPPRVARLMPSTSSIGEQPAYALRGRVHRAPRSLKDIRPWPGDPLPNGGIAADGDQCPLLLPAGSVGAATAIADVMQGFAERSISCLVRLNQRSQIIGRSLVSTLRLCTMRRHRRRDDCAAGVQEQGAATDLRRGKLSHFL